MSALTAASIETSEQRFCKRRQVVQVPGGLAAVPCLEQLLAEEAYHYSVVVPRSFSN